MRADARARWSALIPFSPTKGSDHVNTSMKLGSQYGCGEQLNWRMFMTLFSYFKTAAWLGYNSDVGQVAGRTNRKCKRLARWHIIIKYIPLQKPSRHWIKCYSIIWHKGKFAVIDVIITANTIRAAMYQHFLILTTFAFIDHHIGVADTMAYLQRQYDDL